MCFVGTDDSDPLGKLRNTIAATADLRAESGRLSARRVAREFGLTLAQLASAIDKPRQTVWKTDDAEAIQPLLFPFERVARLRTVLSESDFRKWLNMPARELGRRSPIELIRSGDAGTLADFAEEILQATPEEGRSDRS